MRRYCFLLQVRPELLAEYRSRHAAVWPDMLQALHDSGWHRYSLFARDDGLLVGYVEADDLTKAQEKMAATEVNGRWQESMSRFFIGLRGRPDEGFLVLGEVFNLDDQLARLAAHHSNAGTDNAGTDNAGTDNAGTEPPRP